MQRLMVIMVILLLMACSPLPSPGEPVTSTPELASSSVPLPANTPILTPLPGLLPGAVPTHASSLTPAAVLTQTPGKPSKQAGWKTYTDPQTGFQIDYPADWMITNQNDIISFTSPQQLPVTLAKVNTGGLPPQDYQSEVQIPNTYCMNKTSRYGVQYSRCFDTIAHFYAGDFLVKDAQGMVNLFSLALRRNGDAQVFDEMIDTLRLAK